jgi:hypothetical protein
MDSRDRIKRSKENIHGAMLSAFFRLSVFILSLLSIPVRIRLCIGLEITIQKFSGEQ